MPPRHRRTGGKKGKPGERGKVEERNGEEMVGGECGQREGECRGKRSQGNVPSR